MYNTGNNIASIGNKFGQPQQNSLFGGQQAQQGQQPQTNTRAFIFILVFGGNNTGLFNKPAQQTGTGLFNQGNQQTGIFNQGQQQQGTNFMNQGQQGTDLINKGQAQGNVTGGIFNQQQGATNLFNQPQSGIIQNQPQGNNLFSRPLGNELI